MRKIYFWYKSAAKPESEDKDKPFFYEVEEEQSIRDLVRVLKGKIIGNRMNFSEIHPDNPSTKRWVEDAIEFKSASDYISCNKPKKFAREKLVPTIKSYIEGGTIKRYCILYGIEDNSKIQPIYHLKSDQISEIEKTANEELKGSKVKVSIQPIPFKDGTILAVFIIPTSGGA